MTCRPLLAVLLILLLPTGAHPQGHVDLPARWQSLVVATAEVVDPGERAAQISAGFLGTPYVAATLGGGEGLPEQLVARFDAVDCFTLLDYVEALRRSAVPTEFSQRLVEVRYRDGRVAWETRRHFFTDWALAPERLVDDVTAEVGDKHTRTVHKQLNRKGTDGFYLAGIAVRERRVQFIPGAALDAAVFARLRPGDYLGLYSPDPGLDVTHVGIVVRAGSRLVLRHASSRQAERRVVDSDLAGYFAGKPGIVVLRPQALPSR